MPDTQPKNTPVFLTVKDVAARYQISVASVYRWVKEGSLPKAVQLAKNCSRWHLDDLLEHESRLRACILWLVRVAPG